MESGVMRLGFGKIIIGISLIILLISTGFVSPVAGAAPPQKYDGTIGVVSIGFDHGFYSQWNPMMYLSSKNFSGTVYVVTNRAQQNPNLFSWSNLHTLYNLGFEMASHSRLHLVETSGLSNATLYSEIYGSKLDLQNQGFNVCGFIIPALTKNATTIAVIDKFYNYSSASGINPNTLSSIAQSKLQNGIPYLLIMGTGDLDPSQLGYLTNFTQTKYQIDKAIQNKAFLHIHFHDIVNSTSDYTGLQYPVSFSWYKQTIDYIKQKSDQGVLKVETLSQAMGFGKQCEIVTDKTPPSIAVPTDLIIQTASSGAQVNYIVTATDNVGLLDAPTCNPASGSIFPKGNTTVTCTATDWAGNIGTSSFKVIVINSKIDTLLSINPISNVPWGSKVTVSGFLTNSSGAGIKNKIISFSGTGAANLKSAITNDKGFFSSSGAAPSTVLTGLTIQAHFVEDSRYNKKDSAINSYDTLKRTTQVALNVPGSMGHGHTYAIDGTLKDSTGILLASKTITFTTTTPPISNATTDSSGKYTVSSLVAPSIGTYHIQANYAGDSLYASSSSPNKVMKVT